jgi:hypothetical protein
VTPEINGKTSDVVISYPLPHVFVNFGRNKEERQILSGREQVAMTLHLAHHLSDLKEIYCPGDNEFTEPITEDCSM